jgi:N4-gp56 family major capsid protein
MADTAYGVNASEAVKLWSRKLAREALRKTYIKNFMGPGSDSMIQIKPETNKGPGDRVRVTLRYQLTGDGVQGDGIQEGNEESLTTFTDDLIINQLRHAVRSEGKMTEARIPFDIREEAMMGLSDWWADRWDTWFFNQIAGYTPQTDTRYSGHNAITAPTTTANNKHQVWPGSSTADESLNTTGGATATDVFTLSLIDKAVEAAKTVSPPIRPILIDGEKWFVVFIHPFQTSSLRTFPTTSTAQVTWYDLQKSFLQGSGGNAQNPLFTGALGTYTGCILHESYRVPQGVNSSTGVAITTARRAILCGAQAAVAAFGEGHDKNSYDWFEQLFDYGNKLGVKAGCISGLKKSVYNSVDFATVVMSSKAIAGNIA